MRRSTHLIVVGMGVVGVRFHLAVLCRTWHYRRSQPRREIVYRVPSSPSDPPPTPHTQTQKKEEKVRVQVQIPEETAHPSVNPSSDSVELELVKEQAVVHFTCWLVGILSRVNHKG